MFGDYFQHDAHELLRCVLTHIDDAVSDLRRFCSDALTTMTDVELTSLTSDQTVSHSISQAAEFSYDTVISPVVSAPSISLLTSTVESCSPLSSSVNGKPQGAERSSHRSRTVQSWSQLSSSVNGKPEEAERSPYWTRSVRSWSPMSSSVDGKPQGAESPCRTKSVWSCSPLFSRVKGKPQGAERSPYWTRSMQSWSPVSSSVNGKPQVAERNPRWTRSVWSCSPLSSSVNGKPQGAERTPCRSVSRYWHSPPPSLCRHLVVDVCMPRKCQSLSALPQKSSAAIVVSPDLCDRLKRKRKSSWSSVIYYQQVPMKCKNIGFLDGCTSVVDDLGKNCEPEPAASDCLQDRSLAHGDQTYKLLVNELLKCDSEDCDTEELADNTQLACDTLHGVTDGAVSAVVSDGHCSLEAFPQSSGYSSLSARHQLLLSLHAIESGRLCYISLCRKDTSGLLPEVASFRDCISKDKKTLVKNVGVRRHVSRVQDMFGGEMSTETKCLNCCSVTRHSEPYEDVALFAGHSVHSRMCHISLCCCAFIHYRV